MVQLDKLGIDKRYLFDDFILTAEGMLIRGNCQVKVPPKELAVLTILLDAGGAVVDKGDLLDAVWPFNGASEESLTRCIYALRRALQESKTDRFIETAYGKGYRFSRHVVVVSRGAQSAARTSLAILPFRSHDLLNVADLQDRLVTRLSRYAPYGLAVLPTAVTRQCHGPADIAALIDRLRPGYYLAGHAMPCGLGVHLRVELVRSDGHELIHVEDIHLDAERPAPYLELRLTDIVTKRIPGLALPRTGVRTFGSVGEAVTFMHARYHLQRHTPSGLLHALAMFEQCLGTDAHCAQLHCGRAECYFALAQLGTFDQCAAMHAAKNSVDNALAVDCRNPHALSQLAILSSLRFDRTVANTLFEQALLLAPENPYVHYHYAWHLMLEGQHSTARRSLDRALQLDPTFMAAGILRLWASFYERDVDHALAGASQILMRHSQAHPVLLSSYAVALAWAGRHAEAIKLVESLHEGDRNAGLICANRHYVRLQCGVDGGRQEADAFLSNVDCRQVRASLLPLILELKGLRTARDAWREMCEDSYPWQRFYRHDPRLDRLFSL